MVNICVCIFTELLLECTGDIYMVYGEYYGLDCSTFGSDTSCSYHQTFGCASSTDDIDWYNIFPDGYFADVERG